MINKHNIDRLNNIAKSNMFIIFIFAILSIISGALLWHDNILGLAWDVYFHYSRIYEIKNSIINGGLLPVVSLNKFYQNGSAVMSMYPKINILPIALLSFVIKDFPHLIHAVYILRNFLSLIVSYFASYTFNKNKKISFLFSITYTFSSLTLFYCFTTMDMGISSSLIFLPIVLFGCQCMIKHNKWIELTIGMSLTICSHVINSVMVTLLVLVLLLLNYKRSFDKLHLKLMLKVILSIILLTGIFWVPFLILNLNNNISLPPVDNSLFHGIGIRLFVYDVIHMGEGITFIACIGAILSIINYKTMSSLSKQLFSISIIVLIISSQLFPWHILKNTFVLSAFQRPARFLIIPQLLLCYLFAENCIKLLRNKKYNIVIFVIILIAMIAGQVVGQVRVMRTDINHQANYPEKLNVKRKIYTDYYPQNSLGIENDIITHEAIYDNNRKTPVKLLGNGRFSFNLNRSSKSLKIPFLIYNDINYQVKVDGRNTKFSSDNHSQLTLGRINKGKHTVQVIVHKSWYDYLSYVLSALGVIGLAFAWIKSLMLKRKIKE